MCEYMHRWDSTVYIADFEPMEKANRNTVFSKVNKFFERKICFCGGEQDDDHLHFHVNSLYSDWKVDKSERDNRNFKWSYDTTPGMQYTYTYDNIWGEK